MEKHIRTRLPGPDIVRLFAMLLVVLYHFNTGLSDRGISSPFVHVFAGKNVLSGELGSAMFLILSGMMAFRSYDGRKERTLPGRIGNYYLKRALSILPIYYTAYFIAFLFLRMPLSGALNGRLLYTLAGMDGYLEVHGVHTWYLLGEWFIGAILILYLTVPLLVPFRKKLPPVFLVCLAALKAAGIFFAEYVVHTNNDVLFYLPEFMLGIFLGGCKKSISPYAVAAAAAVSLVLILVKMPFDRRYCILLLSGAVVILFLYAGQRMEKPGRLIRIKGFLSAAAGSAFAVFLTHHLVSERVIAGFPGDYMGRKEYLLYLSVTILLSVLSALLLKEAGDALRNAAESGIRRLSDRGRTMEKNTDSKGEKANA